MNGLATADDALLNALRDVEDPEFTISIVDMGLVVGLERTGTRVDLKITFTAMGCPATDMIIDDARARLLREPGVEQVGVEVVWDPIWTKNRLSPDARADLRALGISV